MNQIIFSKLTAIKNKKLQLISAKLDIDNPSFNMDQELNKFIDNELIELDLADRQRILNEIDGWGPLQDLIKDRMVSEIIVNGPNDIFYEKNGHLQKHSDCFFEAASFEDFVERLAQQCQANLCYDKPFIETRLGNHRITVIYKGLSPQSYQICFRQQIEKNWTLDQLCKQEWCTAEEKKILKTLLEKKKNFLFVGGTSSGKTSSLQALINEIPDLERLVILEDTHELNPNSSLSTNLTTFFNIQDTSKSTTLRDLLIRALRLRPDRLVVGEIRGEEATQLLLALATGHDGSFGSLHASSAKEALLRLEMLVQMGAPQWSTQTIKQLILQTLQYIVVVKKCDGVRKLEGIYKICSLENTGFCLEKMTS